MVDTRNVNVAEALQLVQDGALLWTFERTTNGSRVAPPPRLHVALNDVPDHLEELPSDRLIVCVCRSGAQVGPAPRSSSSNRVATPSTSKAACWPGAPRASPSSATSASRRSSRRSPVHSFDPGRSTDCRPPCERAD